MDLLAGYGSESDSEEEIVKETKQEVKPKLQFDLPKPSNVPLTDLALPEDIIIEDDEPIVDEKQQKALLFAQIEQEEERSFPARKSSSTASSSSLFSQLPTPKAKQETTKFSLFSSLPAPKEGKVKDELSLPEAKRKTQEDNPQDDSDDEEDRKRPFKKPTIEEGPLSFLPAPKRESAILEEPKPRAAAQQPIIEKPVIQQQQQPEQPVKIVKQESEEDKIKKEKQQQMQRQKSQQKQQFFRNLVQNSVTTPAVQQKEQVEALPEVQPEEQQEMQQQQAYVDPMYTGGFNFPAYVDPATMNSRESRVFTSGNVQFVDVNMNQLKQGWTRAGYSEPIVSSLPAMRDGGKVMPSRDAKRQGHISHLVWDLHQKLPELESKRAEGAKKKKESRLKYGF